MAQNLCKFGRALSRYYVALWAVLQVWLSQSRAALHIEYEYRWKKSEDDVWSCALHGRILSLRQDATHLHYRAKFPDNSHVPLTPSPEPRSTGKEFEEDDTEALVQHYLNLGPNLTELYEQWSTADTNFKNKAPKFTGVRILKQDAWEALVGFICSSNNNIIRISQMVCLAAIKHYLSSSLIGHPL